MKPAISTVVLLSALVFLLQKQASGSSSFWHTTESGHRQFPPPFEQVLGHATATSGQPTDCSAAAKAAGVVGCVVLPMQGNKIVPAAVPLMPVMPPSSSSSVFCHEAVGCVRLPSQGDASRRLPDEPEMGDGVENVVQFNRVGSCASPPINVPMEWIPANIRADGKAVAGEICFPPGYVEQRHAAVADLDGDGNLDIVVATSGRPNTLHLGDGSGRFQQVDNFPGCSTLGERYSGEVGVCWEVAESGKNNCAALKGTNDQAWMCFKTRYGTALQTSCKSIVTNDDVHPSTAPDGCDAVSFGKGHWQHEGNKCEYGRAYRYIFFSTPCSVPYDGMNRYTSGRVLTC